MEYLNSDPRKKSEQIRKRLKYIENQYNIESKEIVKRIKDRSFRVDSTDDVSKMLNYEFDFWSLKKINLESTNKDDMFSREGDMGDARDNIGEKILYELWENRIAQGYIKEIQILRDALEIELKKEREEEFFLKYPFLRNISLKMILVQILFLSFLSLIIYVLLF